MARGVPKVTLPTVQVLIEMLGEPGRQDWFGREIARSTGLGSSSVLQILWRLENWGWLESESEDERVARRERRPKRIYYRLTAVGRQQAVMLVRQRLGKHLTLPELGGD